MPLSLEYIAGIFDGEGCVFIYRDSRWGSYTLSINIANTYYPMLVAIQEQLGGNLKHLANSNDVWQLVWSSKKARDVLVLLFPYLVVKREQAAVAIEFQDLARQTGAKKVDPDVLADRECYRLDLQELKKKRWGKR